VGLPYKDKKLFSQYSLGMKQRLAIALAVMHDPELLILDEPINGLDPIGIAEVRSFIRELCDAKGKTILISSHILSEISLLADDIGIIDHGVLLEEESLAGLEQKSSRHIHFTLSDTAQAARILECSFHEKHFSIQDDRNMRLHNLDLPVGKIVTAFVENGLEVSEAHTCEESLEDYFKRVTGGEGIA
ncbi:MAG: ATP-binding cassette domain-containing protein, partial [Eisenbergiella sp.]